MEGVSFAHLHQKQIDLLICDATSLLQTCAKLIVEIIHNSLLTEKEQKYHSLFSVQEKVETYQILIKIPCGGTQLAERRAVGQMIKMLLTAGSIPEQAMRFCVSMKDT